MAKDKKEKLIVIGNGMAGMRAVEEILSRDSDRYAITVFGAEPRVNYNRIMLSPLLAGEKTFDEIVINDDAYYQDNDIDLVLGDPIVAIDRDARTTTTESGKVTAYDRLIIATGSNPLIIPLPGKDLDGVIAFRDVDDVDTMLAASENAATTGKKAVVIGGGLLGLEAAHGLNNRGMEVTVLHLMPHLMERQLDPAAAFLLRQELEGRGMNIVTEADSQEILGDNGKVTGIKLKDGTVFDADLIVMAVGIRPNIAVGQVAGLDIGRGIQVDDFMMTSDPNIFAVGECVEHRGMVYGLVAPLYEMAKILADVMTGKDTAGYQGSALSTKLKVSGVDLFSAGEFQGENEEDIVYRDAAKGIYKRLIINEGRIVGSVLYGDTDDGSWYFQMIKGGDEIAEIRDTMIFGQDFESGGDADPFKAVAALPADAEICGCNGVCKGTVVDAIAENGLTSLDEVRAHTKASSSCGSCTGLVEKLLAFSLGDSFEADTGPKPMCKCTDYPHSDVRRMITSQGLKSIPAVMQALEWKSVDGCPSCRPALNYYLLCEWPLEYVDHAASRFINERVHANIQKDGSYSVVPRMWGGLTSAKELRAIADVVDKFDIPTVKVTGGQRIDLFGVQKEDLPAVWADLNDAGMVSGHAYGKSLRTVKTCVGSDWCRFGTQDSTGLGVKLEEATWGSWMPHKFKMAVSGCPRNCAEATIKDFGVICVDSGYELQIGGNAGIHLRGTDLLCKVETEEEVLEYCLAFTQLYREEGWYLERTAPYLERVGMEHIQERVVNDADSRKALHQRFLVSQTNAQVDPWKERAERRVDTHEFKQLELAS